ncbi:MAG TPA: hypothetical protein VFI95_05565 [Terriglobales bacterium]|nr:hypothetical protein [Terriglobales bacterium]
MSVDTWLRSNVDYTRKLVHSAVEGAHSGESAFLHDRPLAPFLGLSARSALQPAAIGALLGALAAYTTRKHKEDRALACVLLGAGVGFATALAWNTRQLGEKVASTAWKQIAKARDEHWLEKNPIDYA